MANTHSLDLENGSSQYAYSSDADNLSVVTTGALSVEFWVKCESLSDNNYVICKGTTGQYEYGFVVGNSTGQVALSVWTTSGTTRYARNSAAGVIVVGQWYHIAVTIDNNAAYNVANLKLYINGLNHAGTTGGADSALGNGTQGLNVGKRTDTSAYFDGLVDEVRVWDDVRTPTEIHDNIFKDVTGQTGLVGYWKLNNDYTDSSGNGNTLTASGSPVFSTTVPHNRYASLNPKALGGTVLGSSANLVAYYRLDGNATDATGNDDGSEVGTIAYSTGKFGDAFASSNSTSDYIDSLLAINSFSSVSISCWLKANSATIEDRAITNDEGGYDNSFQFGVAPETNTYSTAKRIANVYQDNDTSSRAVVEDVQDIIAGEWYHVVLTYDTANFRLYVNGILVDTAANASAAFNSTVFTFSSALRPWDGYLDDVAFFNRALTAQEIFDLYVGNEVASGFFLMF